MQVLMQMISMILISGDSFNVFCYNVQPGVTIDYKDGSNKEYSTKTREEIIADGYDPCKRCNP